MSYSIDLVTGGRNDMTIEQEICRLNELFKDADPTKIAILEGHIYDNALIRIQITQLNEIAARSGLIKVHPSNPMLQKETPVCKALIRLRANYINSTKLLCKELGASQDEFDDDLEGFE